MEKINQGQLEDKLKSAEFVILDFSSPGCAPCKKIPPLIERVMTETGELDLAAYEIDVSENPEVAQRYFVLGVPTMIVFKNGQEIQRFNSVPKIEKVIKALA
jgi:thioredoxin 1